MSDPILKLPVYGLSGASLMGLSNLGFVLGTIKDDFVTVHALPEGWSNETDQKIYQRGSVIRDEKGNVRIHYWTHDDLPRLDPENSTDLLSRFDFVDLFDGKQTFQVQDEELRGDSVSRWSLVPGLTISCSLLTEPAGRSLDLDKVRNAGNIFGAFLPDYRNPFAYWGQDCSHALQNIKIGFERLERESNQKYAANNRRPSGGGAPKLEG